MGDFKDKWTINASLEMSFIKLRMEMGNVPKRQQPDHRKKKKTAEGHQQVFNVARNSRTRRRPSAGP